MGMYKYISKLWKNPKRDNTDNYRQRLMQFRTQGAAVRVAKPTRLDRARALGYKAKQGVVIVRVAIKKGGRKRESTHMGRKPSKLGKVSYSPKLSFQTVAEMRAVRKYPNLRTLNSYEVGDDGKHKWFEVILLDTGHPQIFNDPQYAPLCTDKNRRREFRGLTSSGKKGRGLRHKGIGAERNRPSIRAKGRQGK